MITLDGVVLSGSLQWTDRHGYSFAEQERKVTLGGKSVFYSKALQGGRPITLVATEETGWITKTMLDDLIVRASNPGLVYTLNFHGEVHQVIFRHEDSPALDFAPLQPRAQQLSTDVYIGTLKLITI
jgi:hypothetical protein